MVTVSSDDPVVSSGVVSWLGFSQARIAHQDDWLGFGDVLATRQVQDSLFVELGDGTEVKIGQLLEHGEAGRFDALALPVEVTLLHFLVGQGQ